MNLLSTLDNWNEEQEDVCCKKPMVIDFEHMKNIDVFIAGVKKVIYLDDEKIIKHQLRMIEWMNYASMTYIHDYMNMNEITCIARITNCRYIDESYLNLWKTHDVD